MSRANYRYRRVGLRFLKDKNAWQIVWTTSSGNNKINLLNTTDTPYGWIAGKPKRGYSHLRVGQFVPAPHKFFDLSGGIL